MYPQYPLYTRMYLYPLYRSIQIQSIEEKEVIDVVVVVPEKMPHHQPITRNSGLVLPCPPLHSLSLPIGYCFVLSPHRVLRPTLSCNNVTIHFKKRKHKNNKNKNPLAPDFQGKCRLLRSCLMFYRSSSILPSVCCWYSRCAC